MIKLAIGRRSPSLNRIFFSRIRDLDSPGYDDLSYRVLQEKEFERVGGERSLKSNARVIAATNKDLWQMVNDGIFREDLYYRLNVFSITLPPLRERKSDVALIARFFIKKYAQAMNKQVSDLSPETMEVLMRYEWPGNVRELRNVIERAIVVARGSVIEAGDLSFPFPAPAHTTEEDSLEEVEKSHIKKILDRTGGNIAQAANILKISRLTLYNKIEKYRLKK